MQNPLKHRVQKKSFGKKCTGAAIGVTLFFHLCLKEVINQKKETHDLPMKNIKESKIIWYKALHNGNPCCSMTNILTHLWSRYIYKN